MRGAGQKKTLGVKIGEDPAGGCIGAVGSGPGPWGGATAAVCHFPRIHQTQQSKLMLWLGTHVTAACMRSWGQLKRRGAGAAHPDPEGCLSCLFAPSVVMQACRADGPAVLAGLPRAECSRARDCAKVSLGLRKSVTPGLESIGVRRARQLGGVRQHARGRRRQAAGRTAAHAAHRPIAAPVGRQLTPIPG